MSDYKTETDDQIITAPVTGTVVINIPKNIELRDYFAAKAMVAFMSNPAWVHGLDKAVTDAKRGTFKGSLAANCYEMADAMLAERAK